MQFLIILVAISSEPLERRPTLPYSDVKYLIGFSMTPRTPDLEWPRHDAKICFLCRFDWTRLRAFEFEHNYTKAEKIDIHRHRRKCSPETLVYGDMKLMQISAGFAVYQRETCGLWPELHRSCILTYVIRF